MQRTDIEKWYDERQGQYGDFVRTAKQLIETLLQEEKILYHSVSGRLKDRDSCVEKFFRKEYSRPDQVMDLAGIRIITHTTAEIKQVCDVIEREFQVDSENSGDKAQEMGVDRVGYLSVHYVVKIRSERSELREYARFKGLYLEIQVRSLLQHAWAEIEHDREYKFAGKLPPEIERKFHLIAGTLELMDEEFRTLSEKIDQYAEHVAKETQNGNLDISIDSTSLLQFLEEYYQKQYYAGIERNYQATSKEIIDELNQFGITTLQQLKVLLDKHPVEDTLKHSVSDECERLNYVGILREAMIEEAPEKYFHKSWQNHWTRVSDVSLERWNNRGVSKESLDEILKFSKPKMDKDRRIYTISLKTKN